jgi:hypothetical protein
VALLIFFAGRCTKKCETVIQETTTILTDTVLVEKYGSLQIQYAQLTQTLDSISKRYKSLLIIKKPATDSIFIHDSIFESQYLKFYNDTIANDDGNFFIETGVLGDLLSLNLSYNLKERVITNTVTNTVTAPRKPTAFLLTSYDLMQKNIYFGGGYDFGRLSLQGQIGKESVLLGGSFDFK